MKTTLKLALAGLAVACATAAGAQDLSAAGFTGQQLRGGMDVDPAIVLQVLQANVEKAAPARTAVGTGLGALLGGLAGHAVGKGNGRVATTAIGGVAGGLVGSAIMSPAKTCALTIVVRSDRTGREQGIAHECGGYQYAIGQKVLVLTARADGVMRVVPAAQ